ncbi:S8 family serine peptidase [Pseudoalteromonas sp. T1lg65]|uniref:S8 family serine peptidase n=1 Tax=Pseudoalteromonas sp. T1lg65 TaxID=2077101 RepID=UPI003F798CC8
MKKFKLASLITLSVITMHANAGDIEALASIKEDKKIVKIEQPDFGAYKIVHGVSQVPASLANPEMIIQQQGDMAVVKSGDTTSKLTKGVIVKNLLTGKFAPTSGNITVLLKKGSSPKAVAERLGLLVKSNFANGEIAVLSVPAGQDLLEILNKLKAQPELKEARIEVLDTLYETR